MQGETDCNDMAVYLWNLLQKSGVKTLLVIGTPDGEYTPFADCDHAWLACNTPDGYIHIEPTAPMVIYGNYVYTFRTSEEIDEDMAEVTKVLEESGRDSVYKLMSPEGQEAALTTIRSDLRYIRRERPSDYSDFDYRQGYYYAKPSDLRKDIGERW